MNIKQITKLTGEQFEELETALISAFPSIE